MFELGKVKKAYVIFTNLFTGTDDKVIGLVCLLCLYVCSCVRFYTKRASS